MEQFLGKHVRIIQQDGFTKYGTVEKIDGDFIYLRHNNGKQDAISREFVKSVTEVDG